MNNDTHHDVAYGPAHAYGDAASNPSNALSGHVIVDEHGKPYPETEETKKRRREKEKNLSDRIKSSDRWMIILTAIIAVSTIGQGVIAYLNSKSSSDQIDKLITSADRIDDAADSFSKSSADISRSTNDAVLKLNRQARATERAADAAKSAADTAKEALVDGQRAVMALEDFNVTRQLGNKDDVDGLQIRINWKNSGSTATKNLVYWSNWRIQKWDQTFDTAFKFNDVFDFSAEKVPYTRGFATPQKSVAYVPIVIPRNIVAPVQAEQIELVFWGEATYNDVFGSKPHISEFCLIVRGFDGADPLDATAKSGTTYPRFINCAVHNCHDDECKTK